MNHCWFVRSSIEGNVPECPSLATTWQSVPSGKKNKQKNFFLVKKKWIFCFKKRVEEFFVFLPRNGILAFLRNVSSSSWHVLGDFQKFYFINVSGCYLSCSWEACGLGLESQYANTTRLTDKHPSSLTVVASMKSNMFTAPVCIHSLHLLINPCRYNQAQIVAPS